MNRLMLIVGPSGTGKSTLAKNLAAQGVPELVSHTTRAPRTGEVNGVNYHYVSREDFEAMLARGEFIEHVNYNGNLYGVARSTVEGALQKSDHCVVVEGHGAEQLENSFPENKVYVFLRPPGASELIRRMEARGDKPEDILTRLKSQDAELAFSSEADYWLFPDTEETMTRNALKMIAMEKAEEARA